MTSNYVVYFHSYFHYLAAHFSFFTAKMFLIFIQDTSVLTGTEVRRVGNPINASQEEFLWSLVAPVDIFHQDFVTKSITPTCRLGGQTALRTNRVHPLSQSFQNKSAWRWTKTSAAGLWNALLVVLLSFLVMTDDLRIITRLLKRLLFFLFPFWCAPVGIKGPSSLRESCSRLWRRVERFYFASFQTSLSTSLLLPVCSRRQQQLH